MKQHELIISDQTALWQLLEKQHLTKKIMPRTSKIILNLDRLTPSETYSWQRKLNSLYSDCGCSTGAIAMFLSIVVYLLYLFFGPEGVSSISRTDGLIGVLVFFVSAGAGKVLGISRARWNFRRAVKKLVHRLQEPVSE